MNLLNFIKYLRNPSEIEKVILEEVPELDIDYADIYLEEELSIYSKMYFFNAEEIKGEIEMNYEGKKLINLFPLYYLEEIFDEFSTNEKEDITIATKILNFRIKDA